MTYFGVAISGQILHSTNDDRLFDFGQLGGDVSGLLRSATVTSLRGTDVAFAGPVDGQALVYDGDTGKYVPSGVGGSAGVSAHNLLSATHGDTVANAVTRGSIIYGNNTPAWDELALGTTGFVLYSDGTDLGYTQLGAVTPFSLGTEGAPSHTFVGDLDTGWSAAAADVLIGSASGLGLLRLDGPNQLIDLDGGQTVRTNAQGTSYTVARRDYVIAVTATPVTITLPASPVEGRIVVIKDRDGNASGGSRVTIDGNGNNVDGNASISISNSYGSFTLLYSGTEWNVI